MGRTIRFSPLLLACLAWLPGGSLAAGKGHLLGGSAVLSNQAEEALLVSALQDVSASRLDSALERLQALLRKQPNFRLAQLVYADLLLAKAGPISDMGNHPLASGERVADLREEALKRLRHHLDSPPSGAVPAALLRLAADQRQAVVVDVAQSRLYLFANDGGRPRLIADYYASTGKNGSRKREEGDQKTPLGVYFVTGRIEPGRLPDFYGTGAFPVNYPNEWDERQGRTGHGIWIHGVPTDTYSRPPQSSDGCVALANTDLERLEPFLEAPTTPVIIGEGLEWRSPEEAEARYQAFRRRFEAWHRDWESLDTARYARHYSREFRSGWRDYRIWVSQKRRTNRKKQFLEVKISDLSVFAYPGEPDLLVASFLQDYRSDTFQSQLRKRQYWRREADGVWRIIYEGVAS